MSVNELMISADSHVVEPLDLWVGRLPGSMENELGPLADRTGLDKPGATDPRDRLDVMMMDNVSMEVLFPTRVLKQYSLKNPSLQEACFRIYNDWIAEYCEGTPGRLVGVPAIPTYDIDHAIEELHRSNALGLKGALTWHVPPKGLEYSTAHYDRLWAAISEMGEPLNLHILTGFSYASTFRPSGIEHYRGSVETKVNDAIHTLFDFIFYGVLERFPKLKLVLAEFEIGWLPWLLQQWDYYVRRFRSQNSLPIELLPSEYFERQIYATFVNDAIGTTLIGAGWGVKNCMWSNDFPHGNTSWPESQKIIQRDLASLDPQDRAHLLWRNVSNLYGFEIPTSVNGNAMVKDTSGLGKTSSMHQGYRP